MGELGAIAPAPLDAAGAAPAAIAALAEALIPPQPGDADFEARRAGYAAELAGGVQRFLAARRPDCPWCGSGQLHTRVRLPDLVQRKPGRFAVDACRTCGHVFLNPTLTAAGLDFYYRDFYSGLGEATAEMMYSWQVEVYRSRARTLAAFGAPRTWLDIGTGWGHFAKDASSVLPDTAFDGLDGSPAVLAGQARGWIRDAYHGTIEAHADSIAGRYDVISMFHYLEHLPDPRTTLDLAARLLAPGSYLFIEVPDPECPLGRFLGPLWTPGYSPQHLHLIPQRNLLAALVERDLIPVQVQRREAHLPIDLTSAVMAIGRLLGPDPRLPWRPRGGAVAVARNRATWHAAPRALRAAYKLDQWLAPVLRATGTGNVYRVLARRGSSATRPTGATR